VQELEIKNLRFTRVRTCYTCKYGYLDGNGAFCCKKIKDDDCFILFDAGDGRHHEMVCDRWCASGQGGKIQQGDLK
jgi:hypothetical protein